MTNTTNKKPDFDVKYPLEINSEKTINKKIGVAWSHSKGGGINIDLDMIPVGFTGRLVLFPVNAEEQSS